MSEAVFPGWWLPALAPSRAAALPPKASANLTTWRPIMLCIHQMRRAGSLSSCLRSGRSGVWLGAGWSPLQGKEAWGSDPFSRCWGTEGPSSSGPIRSSTGSAVSRALSESRGNLGGVSGAWGWENSSVLSHILSEGDLRTQGIPGEAHFKAHFQDACWGGACAVAVPRAPPRTLATRLP